MSKTTTQSHELTYGKIEKWAEQNSCEHKVEKTSVGNAAVINDKLAIVINPSGSSSQELRDLQDDFQRSEKSLYYIFSWEENSDKLLSHFESKLHLDDRKYSARKLLLEEISNSKGDAFMEAYHIQGKAAGAGKISIGLKLKTTGELLAVQQFCRYRFGGGRGKGSILNSPVWEGLRLCFKPTVQIYGGTTKLQKYFEETYEPEKIISYINASHSIGDYKNFQGFVNVTNDRNVDSFMWQLHNSPKTVTIVDKNGVKRENDPDLSKKNPFLNPNKVAGPYGKGVGQLFYNGKLGSRAQLKKHSENGHLIHNDVILEAIGYRKIFTPGQYKWEKNLTGGS